MDDELKNDLEEYNSMADVLKLLMTKTKSSIKVATLGFYEKVLLPYDENKKYGIISVKPFPLEKDQDEYSLAVYFFNSDTPSELQKGDICCILFLDNDFSYNLCYDYPIEVKSTTTHAIKYGVLINTR